MADLVRDEIRRFSTESTLAKKLKSLIMNH